MKITEKDWKRMYDLAIMNKDGEGIAAIIKNKDKAIARYVAGLKITHSNFKVDRYPSGRELFNGDFRDFGNKALELGASTQEIQETYNTNHTPEKYELDRTLIKNAKLNNRFVGELSKKLLDLGCSLEYIKDGNAITDRGRDAMSRNGIKWTIGYRLKITKDNLTHTLVFDAITDEGDGPTSYVFSNESDRIFWIFDTWTKMGKQMFFKGIVEVLSK